MIDESNALKAKYDNYQAMNNMLEEAQTMLEMLQEEADEEMQAELEEMTIALGQKIESYELEIMLNQPYDHMNAVLEIHPGSGGTRVAGLGLNVDADVHSLGRSTWI